MVDYVTFFDGQIGLQFIGCFFDLPEFANDIVIRGSNYGVISSDSLRIGTRRNVTTQYPSKDGFHGSW
jgi:hypothetical protein